MKKLNITVNGITTNVKSEAAMWNFLRSVRNNLATQPVEGTVKVTTEDGVLFKDITFKTNSKGKVEMVNGVKETCRRQVEKARKAAKALEEKKARKREADRRYRARKKVEKEAQMKVAQTAVENTVETVNA